MKFQYASDLHLEFPENREFIEANPLEPAADILILAGDIIPLVLMDEVGWFFEYITRRWKQVFWVPGNHEYYGYDLSALESSGMIESLIGKNILQINNRVEIMDDCRLIFSTLWSHISPRNEILIHEKLSDFREIRNGSELLDVAKYNQLHEQSVRMLQIFLKIPFEGKTVVVTHHLPTLKNYPVRYKSDPLNEIFATELSDLILEYQPDAWIFGHHHHNVPEFRIGGTRMLTNQLGRVEDGEAANGFYRSKSMTL